VEEVEVAQGAEVLAALLPLAVMAAVVEAGLSGKVRRASFQQRLGILSEE
jgi:hypothetical protein